MEQAMIYLITGVLVVMNLIGFIQMGLDKYRAVRSRWRIPERILIGTALLGGGIGSFLGMYAFRHKTKHLRFFVLLPFAALMDILLILKMYKII